MRKPSSSSSRSNPPPQLVASGTLGHLAIRKWRLANGLEIITAPDPSASSVSYVTTFRVGSRDENPELHETGLAHLFEHLMFTQTRGSAPGSFDRAVESIGGASNASTDHDFTSYVDDVPPSGVARIIALEADRMINLDLLERQVASERDVVLEERLAVVDDSVDGTLDELLYEQAFAGQASAEQAFAHHPYRWPVIGRKEDIQAVTREKATAFYRRYYAPDRAVISVAGRFEEAFVLGEVRTAYGGLDPSAAAGATSGLPPVVAAATTAPDRAPASEKVTRLEKPVPADRFVVGYPAPALAHPDRIAYEVLAELLAGGPSSRLFRRLVVERSCASSVEGQVAPTRDPGLFSLWVQMTRGHDSPEADAILSQEIRRLVDDRASTAEIAAARNRLETQFWRGLGSSHERALALGDFDVTAGDFRVLLARAERYAAVQPGDVQRVAATYFASAARWVVIARPTPRAAPTP